MFRNLIRLCFRENITLITASFLGENNEELNSTRSGREVREDETTKTKSKAFESNFAF